jgi:hypothetical protein
MRRNRHQEELLIRSLLARLGDDVEDPGERQLRAAAKLAAAEGRTPQERPSSPMRPWRPLRLRWVAAAAAAILLATGLGFGVASWLTPAGSAGRAVSGLGFLPAEGWTVVQSGIPGSAESARAVAANVPIGRADLRFGPPLTTLGSWPPWGIAVVATLSVRGEPAVDAAFPVRELPLRFADASRASATEYVLRAGVGGYNVDASISFGSQPTADMLREADDQIARLVVAPAAVTIAVRPTIQGRSGPPLNVYGSVSNGKKDEKVTVQFKQCGLVPVQFRDHAEVLTEDGGGWSILTAVGANGTFRAVAGDDVSNEVSVQARADVRLAPRPPRRFQVQVVEQMSFWRKRVLIQRYDRRLGKWVKVKALRLEHSFAAPGSVYVWSETDEFTVSLPKGTTIRATLPLDQAKPCHIGGYSNLLRT